MNYGKGFCGSGGSVFFVFGWLARFFVVILFGGRGLFIDFGGREEISRVWHVPGIRASCCVTTWLKSKRVIQHVQRRGMWARERTEDSDLFYTKQLLCSTVPCNLSLSLCGHLCLAAKDQAGLVHRWLSLIEKGSWGGVFWALLEYPSDFPPSHLCTVLSWFNMASGSQKRG